MCGCGNNKNNLSKSRPTVLPRQNSIRSVSPPPQIQVQTLTTSGLTTDQRSIEKKRREAIFRKLGRL